MTPSSLSPRRWEIWALCPDAAGPGTRQAVEPPQHGPGSRMRNWPSPDGAVLSTAGLVRDVRPSLWGKAALPPGRGSSRLWTRGQDRYLPTWSLCVSASPPRTSGYSNSGLLASALPVHPSFCHFVSRLPITTCLGSLHHFLSWPQSPLSLSLWLHLAQWHYKVESYFPYGTPVCPRAGQEWGERVGIFGKTSLLTYG